MVNISDQIQELHKLYVELTGMPLKLQFNREHSWSDFIRAGFTGSDLKAVTARLLRLIHEGERRPEALKFSNLIEALDRFEEERAMVTAEEAGLKPVERQLSVMELQRIYDAKTSVSEEIARKHAHHDGFGYVFDDKSFRKLYLGLRQEAKVIRNKLAQVTPE